MIPAKWLALVEWTDLFPILHSMCCGPSLEVGGLHVKTGALCRSCTPKPLMHLLVPGTAAVLPRDPGLACKPHCPPAPVTLYKERSTPHAYAINCISSPPAE